jgi:hypothetical protein
MTHARGLPVIGNHEIIGSFSFLSLRCSEYAMPTPAMMAYPKKMAITYPLVGTQKSGSRHAMFLPHAECRHSYRSDEEEADNA